MVRPVARAPRRQGGQRDVTGATSSGQPAGESPVRGDAWVPGSETPVRGREAGCEAGRNNWPVRSESEALTASLFPPPVAGKREPSRSCGGEGHGRHPRSRSGCRRTLRRSGSGTVRRLSWELGRPYSAPALRETGSGPAYNRRREVAGGREGVGGGRSSDDGRDNTTRPERRAPAPPVHDEGAEELW